MNAQKLGPAYPARVGPSAAKTPNTVNGLLGAVIAGMSVTADIRTGKHRLIEHFIRLCCGIGKRHCVNARAFG